MKVQDIKPNTVLALDVKPVGVLASDYKSNIAKIDTKNEVWYPVTVNAGQPMGLLLTLTYKEGFSGYSPFSR